jgi:hypothetical protein
MEIAMDEKPVRTGSARSTGIRTDAAMIPGGLISPDRVRSAASAAREFLETCRYPLGSAMVDHLVFDVPGSGVTTAIRTFQNPDGGFGRGLEVDIGAPDSNPFATRLAMIALLHVRDGSARELLPPLQQWLVANQSADGDWHLSAATRAGRLAPWFAAWTHPALNPACCMTGLATRLGIATPTMLERTARLFGTLATVDQVASGTFYELLPYSEYLTAIDNVPNQQAFLDAFATRIATSADEIYDDAAHFWDQMLALGSPLTNRLSKELLATWAERLLAEQSADGGWETPYDPAWRPWATTGAVVALVQLSRP